jgi:heat-inducible transcriptional repressor
MENKRKEIILKTIIKEHIKTGAPVGSGVLVDKYKLDISPATVRNEMAELEEEGFIIQPYTSAGRVPTEKAYQAYVSEMKEKKLAEAEVKLLKSFLKEYSEENFRQTAKAIAKISGNAVFWAFHKNNLYYTGISNLLSEPEFMHNNLIYDISAIIDKMDEIININFNKFDFSIRVLLGSENPFSKYCSTVLVKYKLSNNIGLIGILGPMRMDYEKNLALIKFIEKELK